jgi:hypothetical protein
MIREPGKLTGRIPRVSGCAVTPGRDPGVHEVPPRGHPSGSETGMAGSSPATTENMDGIGSLDSLARPAGEGWGEGARVGATQGSLAIGAALWTVIPLPQGTRDRGTAS